MFKICSNTNTYIDTIFWDHRFQLTTLHFSHFCAYNIRMKINICMCPLYYTYKHIMHKMTTHTHIHVCNTHNIMYIGTQTCVCVFVCTWVSMHISTHTISITYVRTYIRTYVCIYRGSNEHLIIRRYTHTRAHTQHTHNTHNHAYMHALMYMYTYLIV